MKLNLGCGDHYAEGWLNVDLPTCPHRKDIEADAFVFLSYCADDVFERTYMGHFLEHIDRKAVALLLREVRLVTAGPILIVGPDDYDAVGGHRWPGDEHRWNATMRETLDIAQAIQPDAYEWAVRTGDGWPVVSAASWQFGVMLP